MPPSIGAAAVQGIESGFALGQRGLQMRQAEQDRLQRERDAEQQRTDLQEERAYQRKRQKAQDARLASQDDRQRRMDELAMLDKEAADLQAEGQGLFSQFGGYDKVPEDVRTDYTGRVRALRGRRGQLRQSFYGATVEEQRRAAAETWARIQSGQMSADELSGDDLVRTLTAQTGRPVSDFLGGRDGSPSVVRQAILDVEAGLQAGNRDLLLRGANVLLQRELSTGVGTEGRDGSEIVGKKLVDLVPHPQDPSRVVPILEISVRREDGAVGTYRAPVTEDRGVYATDPNAMPKALTVQQLVERLGHVGVMEAWVNDPQTRQRIESASPQAKASADEFLQALGAVGVTRPKAGKIARERVDLGDRIEEREVDEATGKVLSVRYLGKGLAPKVRGGSDSTGGRPSTGEQLTGEAFLKTLPIGDRALVLAIAEGRAKPPELTTKDGRRLNALVQQYDPTFDGNKGGFKGEDTLRDEFVKASGDFIKIRNAYGLVQAAARDPSAGGDMALIFSFMRILDPNSVVREGEFATAQNAAGVPDRIVNLYNRVLNGERLNPAQRADFVNQAKKIYDEQQSQNEVLQGTYRDMARRYKLNPDNVVIPLGREPGRPAGPGPVALPAAARSRLKEGQVTTFGNGQRWTLKNGQPVQVQ
jgi:hypothetical protein